MSNSKMFQDFENNLKEIASSLQNHSMNQSQLNHTLLTLQQQLHVQKTIVDSNVAQISKQTKEVLLDIQALAEKLVPEIKKIEDIPVVKHPKWYCIDIPFNYNQELVDGTLSLENLESQQTQVGFVNINPEGPFVITQMMPLYEVGKGHGYVGDLNADFVGFANNFHTLPPALGNLTSNPTGRVIPCTAFSNIINTLGITNNNSTYVYGWNNPSLSLLCNQDQVTAFAFFTDTNTWGPFADIPEFEFQIEIGGSGRFWTNQYIPAAAFYGTNGQPYYMGAYGWVDRGDRLIVHARNLKDLTYSGTIKMIFHGYQMLGHVDIAKALGY
jgi:hypothetical protein